MNLSNQDVTGFKDQGTNVEFTVVLKFNQGTPRHRVVIDGGAFFGSFLGTCSYMKLQESKKEQLKTIEALR